MRLHEHAVDLFKIHGADLVAHGLDERAQAEVAGAPQEPLAGAHDEAERLGREGVVAQPSPVELFEHKRLHALGGEPLEQRRVGDPRADFLIHRKREALEQGRLADQDQVVGVREILAEQAQLAQALGRHEVGVVDDGHQHLAGAMDAESLLDQEPLAVVVAPLKLDLKRFAEDAQRVVIGVQGAVDHGRDHALGIVGDERRLEHALARAGLAKHEAEAALLGVDAEDFKDLALMGQEREGVRVEGIARDAEVGSDHITEAPCGVPVRRLARRLVAR